MGPCKQAVIGGWGSEHPHPVRKLHQKARRPCQRMREGAPHLPVPERHMGEPGGICIFVSLGK